jgi:hypothetical protein
MKKFLTIVLILSSGVLFSQVTSYEWPKKGDPKWTTSNQSKYTLCYHGENNDLNGVSTSFKGELFDNNQITTYTSDTMDFTGKNVNPNIILGVKLKDGDKPYYKDWLYFQYSIDGGINWINPVNNEDYYNNSNVDLTLYSLGKNNNNGWSGNLSEHETFDCTFKGTNKVLFRFVFASNPTINAGNGNGNIYHANIREFWVRTYNSIPLPIELLSFDASVVGKGVELKWVTATESNNSHFEVYNSIDGVNYALVDKIKGAGNSSYEKQYTLLHITPMEGYNYYKLKQIDFDGKSKEFQIVSILVPKFDIIIGDIIYYNMLGQVVNFKEVCSGYYIKVTTVGKVIKKEKIYKSNN